MENITQDYLLNKKVKILQPIDGYRASIDAVILASMLSNTKKGQKILDVGSGTGAISLCLAYRLQNEEINITGLELQERLCNLSNKSSELNGFQSFLEYVNIDISSNKLTDTYDHVITNPPYSENDMASPNYSKSTAHNHANQTLKDWINFCLRRLKQNGYFYMINRAEALNDILYHCYGKIGDIKIIPIRSKTGQDAKRVIIIGKKVSKTPLKILTGLVIHNDNNDYSEKTNEILRNAKGFFEQ